MKYLVFSITLISQTLFAFGLIISLLFPKNRIWPPPGKKSWQFYFIWISSAVAFFGGFFLGLLDWNSFILKHWFRFVIGGIFLIGGEALACWGVRSVGNKATSGLASEFIIKGPYRYTRNPQYIGNVVLFIGYGLICNSILTNIVLLIGIILFLIMPWTEEPWLKEHYGTQYENYLTKTPRFFSLQRCVLAKNT
ncbi:MAG: methyltransferase [Candidatus Omnitrophota bacterium]|jgi:protein-S-isoprenylcysteine O-methyltransferase Ste14